jgi:hypothetical protein
MNKIIEFRAKSKPETYRCDQCGQRRRQLGDVRAVDIEGQPCGIAVEICRSCKLRSAISLLEVAA